MTLLNIIIVGGIGAAIGIAIYHFGIAKLVSTAKDVATKV